MTRIGFDFLKHVFKLFGTDIVVVNETKYDDEKLAEQEIFQELITLIHSFAMRFYSNRRYKKKLEFCEEELKHVTKQKRN